MSTALNLEWMLCLQHRSGNFPLYTNTFTSASDTFVVHVQSSARVL